MRDEMSDEMSDIPMNVVCKQMFVGSKKQNAEKERINASLCRLFRRAQ